jgi:hypothetical protein
MHLPEKICVSNGNAIRLRWPSIVVERAKKNNEFEEAREGGNLNTLALAPEKNVWLWLILRDKNFLVSWDHIAVPMQTNNAHYLWEKRQEKHYFSHAKLTILDPHIV